MKTTATDIPGVIVIEPRLFTDVRGSFYESFRQTRYAQAGIPGPFVQDDRSTSGRNVLRGFHYQVRNPQGHLVTLTAGTIFDVGVDLRRNSPTFGRTFCTTLTADPPIQVYLPAGVAHGFCVLSEGADIWYKCTDFYHPDDDAGLLWSDPDLGIDWPIKSPVLNPRDAAYPRLRDIPPERLPHVSF